ncbi:hypothetical protein HMPREF1033_00462 [Tannerella sp. 6_1_58FAA_CT1]|nr:hypothetical protein HMPREF1033_00462 [Tannerella sp. 6_1_58FAA_CT1]
MNWILFLDFPIRLYIQNFCFSFLSILLFGSPYVSYWNTNT